MVSVQDGGRVVETIECHEPRFTLLHSQSLHVITELVYTSYMTFVTYYVTVFSFTITTNLLYTYRENNFIDFK